MAFLIILIEPGRIFKEKYYFKLHYTNILILIYYQTYTLLEKYTIYILDGMPKDYLTYYIFEINACFMDKIIQYNRKIYFCR